LEKDDKVVEGGVVGLGNEDLDNLDLPNLVEGSDKEKLREDIKEGSP